METAMRAIVHRLGVNRLGHGVRHHFAVLACSAVCLVLAGCSVTGTWRTVSVEPDDAAFPISFVTFDADGHYTATSKYDGHERTGTGSYRWNGRVLRINPEGGAERVYKGQVTANGVLRLTHTHGDSATTASLERTDR